MHVTNSAGLVAVKRFGLFWSVPALMVSERGDCARIQVQVERCLFEGVICWADAVTGALMVMEGETDVVGWEKHEGRTIEFRIGCGRSKVLIARDLWRSVVAEEEFSGRPSGKGVRQ